MHAKLVGLIALSVVAFVLASCAPDLLSDWGTDVDPRRLVASSTPPNLPAHPTPLAHPTPPAQRNFRAHLSGEEEVPPVDTNAQGQVVFQLNREGTELSYKLIAANILDILQAHIHVGPRGVIGSVVVFLYPEAPPSVLIPGRFDGVLAEGTITTDDLIGPLAGEDLSALLAEMAAGNTYVNVHTVANPVGEIRGQVF